MTPKMVKALQDARDAGREGLRWTAAGWWRPGSGVLDYNDATVVSRLMFNRGFLSASGPKSGPRQRRHITDAGLKWIEENGL